MEKIRIAMLDDESLALGIISSGVEHAFRQRDVEPEIHRFLKADILLDAICTQGNAYHLVMLDIKMPGADGIEIAGKLRRMFPDMTIVFISSNEDRVFEAFSVNAFFFIRKTRLVEDISAFVEQYLQSSQRAERNRVMTFSQSSETVSLYPGDIICVESEGRKQKMHIQGRNTPLELNQSMQVIEEELSVECFIRVHKGFIVNNSYINRIVGSTIVLKNGMQVPISRRKLREVHDIHLRLTKQNNTMLR